MDFELDPTVEILKRTPKALRAWLEGLPEPWIVNNEGPETFNAWDVVGHLVSGEEDDWIPRLNIILEHGEARPFTPFDRFAFRDKCRGKTLTDLLRVFEEKRERNLEYLEKLDLGAAQLELKGTHPELGAVSVAQLLATWAVHDLGHIAQIARVMAKQYRHCVGPWWKYLSILKSGDQT